jgi:hypothetical protein
MLYKRYDTQLENLNQQLELNGVATIPNVLTEQECITYRTQIWNEMKYVLEDKFDINDKKTWKIFYELFPLHSMLLQHLSLGQMQPIWDIRQHQKVGQVFEKIWDTSRNDLLVSFDGLSIHLPPEITGRGWYHQEWFHTDQSNYNKNKCIQGLINLYPVHEKDASLAILEGSHKYHQSFFEDCNVDEKNDWYRLENDQIDYFTNKGCSKYAVEADIGSMVLWNSKTMHQGKEPEKGRKESNFRMVIYVCMMPRMLATESVINKRIKAFEELRITNHWAIKPKLFPKLPRTYGNPLAKTRIVHQPVLNDIGKRLVGYE